MPQITELDWVFYQFELCQVVEIEGENITGVSNGYIRTSGRSLNEDCRILSFAAKHATEKISTMYEELRRTGTRLNLNYPDLKRMMVDAWLKLCDETDGNNLQALHSSVRELVDRILKHIQSANEIEIDGIRLFR